MEIRKRLKENFVGVNRLLNTILLSCMMVFLMETMIGIQYVSWQHMITISMITLILTGFYFYAGKGRIFWGIGVICFCFTGMAVFGIHHISTFLQDYINWLFARGNWKEDWQIGYELVNTLWITVLVFVINLLFERYFILKQAAGVGVCLYLLAGMVQGNEISRIGVALSLLFLVLVITQQSQGAGKKNQKEMSRALTFWVTPFLVLYLLLVCLMPAPEKAFDWKFAKDIYKKAGNYLLTFTEGISRLWGREEFDLSFAGFSEEGRLGAGLLDSSREVMTIIPDVALKTNIYLTGKVFDTFENGEWIQTDFSTEQDRETDAIETLYAVKRQDITYVRDYIWQTGLDIRYERFDTGYLFAPVKSLLFQGNKIHKLVQLGGNLTFPDQVGFGTRYTLQYLQLNADHPGFYEMLKAQWNYTYGEQSAEGDTNRGLLLELQREYRMKDAKWNNITEEKLHERAGRIKEIYGKPVELSEPVQDFLDRITEQSENEIEKLKLIEEALSQMTYTVSPGRLPENQDFLDYFLLESKEGYCSYFATAFVLLARAEGIPARYVQGFCVPTGKNEGETIAVLSNMAHAWPEVYLEGVGWIPFEPTPGYAQIRYTPWEMHSPVQVEYGEGVIHYVTGSLEDFRAQRDEEQARKQELALQQEQAQAEAAEALSVERKEALRQLLKLLGITLAVIAGGIVLFILFDLWNCRRKYGRMLPEEKIRADLWRLLNILKLLGYERGEGETLSELRQRIQQEETEVPLTFINSYEEAVYGSKDVTEEILNIAQQEQEKLLSLLRLRKGKAYWYVRIRLYLNSSRKR